jgi:hypothetical protein
MRKGDALGRSRQGQARNPAPMRRGPRRPARIADFVVQEQRRQSMAGLALHRHRVLACAYQIAHRLIGRIGYVDRDEFARACQTRQLQTVAAVGLDPIALSKALSSSIWFAISIKAYISGAS